MTTKRTPDGAVLYVSASDPESFEWLKDNLVRSGMRETKCTVCGCRMLTREADDRCPPCREAAN